MKILKYKKYFENKTEISLDQIFNDCKPFIEEIKKCNFNKLLIRGFNNYISEDDKKILKIEHNWNRIPRDTPEYYHDILNIYFMEKFGWYVRNGVFCYFTNLVSSSYGEPYILFPIGDFNYLWNKDISDLFNYFESDFNEDWDYRIDELFEEWCDSFSNKDYEKDCLPKYDDFYQEKYEEIRDEVEMELKDTVSNYINTNLCDTFYDTEISVNCDEYYLIPITYKEEILKKLKNI